ncbi:MAG: hypothetical protein K2Z80_35065 [Xanthobacteraceae bacterium]|nr:hypothetical protein [Xanthobacteraceae bacterium]
MRSREIAKFAAGFAANQMLTHGAMTATDTEFTMLGVTYTRELNTIATAFWAVLLVLLVYHAWLRAPADGTPRN